MKLKITKVLLLWWLLVWVRSFSQLVWIWITCWLLPLKISLTLSLKLFAFSEDSWLYQFHALLWWMVTPTLVAACSPSLMITDLWETISDRFAWMKLNSECLFLLVWMQSFKIKSLIRMLLENLSSKLKDSSLRKPLKERWSIESLLLKSSLKRHWNLQNLKPNLVWISPSTKN